MAKITEKDIKKLRDPAVVMKLVAAQAKRKIEARNKAQNRLP
jgi:hypothetical protein|tara:strand:- start:184 stop:309 length:126 start_codon:yes stop_codon:yes gene_type:complete